jgi:hypothetical protein
MRLFVIPFLILAAASLCFAASDSDYALEGIMAAPGSKGELCAMINGKILKKGDMCGECKVEEVSQDSVILASAKGGANIRLTLENKRSKAPEQTGVSIEKSSGAAGFNFKGVLNLAVETKAMAELRRIATGAAVLANMDEYDREGRPVTPQIDLQKLADREFIPKALASGRSGPYVYSIRSEGHEYEVHGDPVEASSSLRHFMIDSGGTMYAESGRSATKDSPQP